MVPSAAAGANFPPGSPEDTLNPETRTAQWILNNISKQQGREPRPEIAYPSAPDVSVVPERSPVPAVKESSSRYKAKSPFVADIAAVKTTAHNPHPSYMERITSLETDVVTLQSQLKEKNIQFSEVSWCVLMRSVNMRAFAVSFCSPSVVARRCFMVYLICIFLFSSIYVRDFPGAIEFILEKAGPQSKVSRINSGLNKNVNI